MRWIKALTSFFRYCWALPVSCIGLATLLLIIISGGKASFRAGIIEVEGGILPFLLSRLSPRFAIDAITMGHVILARNCNSLVKCRHHEYVHVRQYERWGILFPMLYLLSSVIALIRGMDPYWDNNFEQEAFRAESDVYN